MVVDFPAVEFLASVFGVGTWHAPDDRKRRDVIAGNGFNVAVLPS